MISSTIKMKSFNFALRIVKLFQSLQKRQKRVCTFKTTLKSGTSVGAMIREGEHSENKGDFIHKLAIAQKEIKESIYWLELLKSTDFLNSTQFKSINKDAVELIKMLISIIKNHKG